MEDTDDFGSFLKKLDELDVVHYTPTITVSYKNINKMTTAQNQETDSNISDFDNSDEDLASLLGDDDDDDIFAKKIHGGSPAKKTTSESSSYTNKNSSNQPTAVPKTTASTLSKATDLKKIHSKDDFNDDILDGLIDSKSKKKSSVDLKSLPAENYVEEDKIDDNFLDNLSLSQFSPSKDLSTNNLIKRSQNKITENSSSFDTSEKSAVKTSKERRGSFFDDFLQKLSPKHDSKKISTDTVSNKIQENEENEEDILGTYIPTTPKKKETINENVSKSPKKRGSLHKQVSFKDVPNDFSESFPDESEDILATTTEVNLRRQSLSEPKKNDKNILTTKRTERLKTSKTEDMDWLNFFKETPKQSTEQLTKKDDTNFEKKDMPNKSRSKFGIKRQSSADWLGLSESKTLDNNEFGDSDNKVRGIEMNLGKLTRPKTAEIPITRSHQFDNKNNNDWNDDNNFKEDMSRTEKSDLMQILKQTTPEKKSILGTSRKSSITPSVRSSLTIKSDYADHIAPRMQRDPDNFISDHNVISAGSSFELGFSSSPSKERHFEGIQKSSEQNNTIHSLQLMLDSCIEERNKLLKENEILKLTYEEKLKSIEELHKTEKKTSEDLNNVIESGLKKEFEIKIKTLEERLNLLTIEKEKQEKILKEKLENVSKEHQDEMQRLRNLHNHSVTVMKEDHEEALSRLKHLKEQELEALLSTQVHSKSLQHLTNQLEARTNELAELQNKVEGQNQSMLREKQALLDAREKDLKVLQNRLHKQLEDSEEERTRLQQLVLRLEGRLQKMTVEGEEDHWEVQQMKAKLTVQQKYLEEEQKLNIYQLEKEKEKLRIAQDSLLHEQKAVLLQLAQERQQFVQEKTDLQFLAKSIKEEEAKLNVKKLKEDSFIESQKQFLQEERNKLSFEKEKNKQELYYIEKARESFQKEMHQFESEKESLRDLELNLKRKSTEIEALTASVAQEREKGRREYSAALSIKTEQKFKMEQQTQQMQMLMDKERQLLSEKEKLMEEKLEFERSKSTILCTKCKLSVEAPVQVSNSALNMSAVIPLSNFHEITSQVQQSFVDPNLVIWNIAAQKDREFLQEELAFLQSLKNSDKKYT